MSDPRAPSKELRLVNTKRGEPMPWPDLTSRHERVAAILAAIAYGLGMVFIAGRLVPVFLSVDGAHAVTDARGLLGLAPRAPYYLPAFPGLLVPLDRLGVDVRVNVAFVLAFTSTLLFVSLYWLARTGSSAHGAMFGAIVAGGSASLSELLAWQGGATLLALVATTSALTAYIRWENRQRLRDAAVVGACMIAAEASHPFMAAMGACVLGVMWLTTVLRLRRVSVSGRGPTGLPGIILAAFGPIVAMGVLAPSYLSIDAPSGSFLRIPDLTTPMNVLVWITRESPALTVLTAAFGLVALAHRGPVRPAAAATLLTFVCLPALLAGDASYQTRVVYLLPPIVGVGAAFFWDSIEAVWIRASSESRFRRYPRLVAAVAAAFWIAALSFPLRLVVAVPYYSTLGSADYQLVETLAGSPGTVAAGWMGNQYWDGMLNAWYIEGITNRPSIGPTDPALTTRQSERDSSARAWQLFSGASGMENGSLQLSFGPPAWRADPAIAARINGSYLPLVFVSDTSNDYGSGGSTAPPIDWTVTGASAIAARRDGSGRSLFTVEASLADHTATLVWHRSSTGSTSSWTIWVWPAYGLPWRGVVATPTTVDVGPHSYEAYRDPVAFDTTNPRVRFTVSGGATMTYYDADPRYGVQAIAIHVPAGDGLDLAVDVSGTQAAGTVADFSQEQLLKGDNVRTVVVWRNSGWVDRFSSSQCFTRQESDESVVVFKVQPDCAGTSVLDPSRGPEQPRIAASPG
jgi:hypothetical protein